MDIYDTTILNLIWVPRYFGSSKWRRGSYNSVDWFTMVNSLRKWVQWKYLVQIERQGNFYSTDWESWLRTRSNLTATASRLATMNFVIDCMHFEGHIDPLCREHCRLWTRLVGIIKNTVSSWLKDHACMPSIMAEMSLSQHWSLWTDLSKY